MTTAATGPQTEEVGTMYLSEVLKRPITAKGGGPLVRLSDVVVRLRGPELPLAAGEVACVGGRGGPGARGAGQRVRRRGPQAHQRAA